MPARNPARDMDWQGLPPHPRPLGACPPVGVGDVPQIGGIPVGGEDRGGSRFDVAHGDRARGPQRLCDAHVQPAVPGEQAQQRGGRWVCVPCWYPCHTAMRHHPAPHTNKTMPTKKHRDGGKITGCSDHWHGGVLHRPQGTLHRRGDVGEDSSTLLPIGVGGPESHVSSPTQRVYKGTPTIGSPIQRP